MYNNIGKDYRHMKTAVIFGVTGQDGSYLAELLLTKGYFVIGVKRRTSTPNIQNLVAANEFSSFTLIEGDITDYSSVFDIISKYRPDEVYNLAAQSHVGTSFGQPLGTWDINAKAVLNILEVLRVLQSDSYKPRFYQASTSEMFGTNISMNYDVQGCAVRYNGPFLSEDDSIYENRLGFVCMTAQTKYDGIFQDENTPFNPQSPYAIAKVAAHQAVGLYRQAYGLHASCGILFNHESPRRGENFVTRKITKFVKNYNPYKKGPKLKLGNLHSQRDWGHAKDYVMAMWLMLQQPIADDYVVATGHTHSVSDFLDAAFKQIAITNWKDIVEIDPQFIRPAEVPFLCGDASKAREKLGWNPQYTFYGLVQDMMDNEKILS